MARKLLDITDFHFGQLSTHEDGRVSGQHILSIGTAWRLQAGGMVKTGRQDHWFRDPDNTDMSWEPGTTWGTYQARVLREVLGSYDSELDCFINVNDTLIVEAVEMDCHMGVILRLSGDIELIVFPSGSQGEHWRLMRSDGSHIVAKQSSLIYEP